MTKFYKILFFSTLIFGTLIAISSYSWMSMWIGLEVNLLSIIPLLKDNKNLYPSESALKYFITQALASAILLFSIIVSLNLSEFISSQSNLASTLIFDSALLVKSGAAPFHAWFPEVLEGLDWINCLIMLTWQKVAPLVLLSQTPLVTSFMSMIIISSSLIGGIMGFNQISFRKIMAYSSINHLGWMIASMMNSQSIFMIYFLSYSVISINIVLIFSYQKIFFLKQLATSLNQNKSIKAFFIMNFLSLGGLPPFLGFLVKWFTINWLIKNDFYMISLILIVSTLVTLFFYMRISFMVLVLNSKEMIFKKDKPMNLLIFAINLVSMAGMLACTLSFSSF
uniref:NADH-ubiquinone oxidoreductase chain 2 n=1 Tax=Bifidoprionus rufus TaxID=2546597 RepID=A0A6H0N216_9CUCU|nr:NADH dehydrogenase subunit 2 [Bifidoprionus rufus]